MTQENEGARWTGICVLGHGTFHLFPWAPLTAEQLKKVQRESGREPGWLE